MALQSRLVLLPPALVVPKSGELWRKKCTREPWTFPTCQNQFFFQLARTDKRKVALVFTLPLDNLTLPLCTTRHMHTTHFIQPSAHTNIYKHCLIPRDVVLWNKLRQSRVDNRHNLQCFRDGDKETVIFKLLHCANILA